MSAGRFRPGPWATVATNFMNSLRRLKPMKIKVGQDYLGNQYFEEPTPHSRNRISARSVIPPDNYDHDMDSESRWEEIPPEWEAWLRRKRNDPPTAEEIQANIQLMLLKRANAAKLEAARMRRLNQSAGMPELSEPDAKEGAASLLLPVLRALSTHVASHASRSTGLLGPAVRNLLEHYQISAEKVEGSGPKGYVLKGDVLSFIRNQKLEPVRISVAPPDARPVIKKELPSGKPGPKDNRGRVKYLDLPVSASLKQSASSLVKSKMAIPHAYLDGLCIVDDALKIFSNKKGLEKVNLTDVVVGAVVKAAGRSSATMITGKQKAMNLEVQAWKDGQLQYHTLENAARLGVKEVSERLSQGSSSASGNNPYKVVSLVGSRLEQITEILSSSTASWVVSVGDVMSRIDAQSKKSSKIVAVSLTYNAALISEYEASEFLENIKTSLERPMLLLLGGTSRIQNQNEDDAFSI